MHILSTIRNWSILQHLSFSLLMVFSLHGFLLFFFFFFTFSSATFSLLPSFCTLGMLLSREEVLRGSSFVPCLRNAHEGTNAFSYLRRVSSNVFLADFSSPES